MKFSLLPRNDAYFEDFGDAMRIVAEMAQQLAAGMDSGLPASELGAAQKKLDGNLYKVVRRCLDRLDASFITPIEREDIHELILTVGDVGEALEVTANRFDIYGVEGADERIRRMAHEVVEMTSILVEAIANLQTLDPATVKVSTTRVRELENTVDDQYREAMRALFARRPEAYDLVRWKDLYDGIEDAADNARHVARTIDRIVVRHS